MRELRPYQSELISDLRDTIRQGLRRIMVMLPTGSGKCLGIGTPVLRYDGTIVPVESIKVGDELMGPDGGARRVLSTCRDQGPLFQINPVKGDSWICNDVHVLTLVETESGRIIDIPLDEYLKKSKWFKHIYKMFAPENGIDFPVKEDPAIPGYFLGLWIGDGTKSLKTLQISKPDQEVRDECERIAISNGGFLSVSKIDDGRCPTYSIVTQRGQPNRMLEKMRNLMREGTIPHCVLTASRKYRLEVLAGIIDTDGFVHHGCCEIAQKSPAIADGIQFLARSVGLKATRTEKLVNGTCYQRMSLSGDLSTIPTRIQRKIAPPRRQKKVATRTGFEVVSIGMGEYAGFELDGDGRFLLGDFTVTHNTVIAAEIIKMAREKGNKVAFVVPKIDLIDQSIESFWAHGIRDIGALQGNHHLTDYSKPVLVCSVQTLQARKYRPECKIVILDEAHVSYAFVKQWLSDPEWENCIFIGLSATPFTRGLKKYYQTLLKPTSISELISLGYLSNFRVFATGHPNLSGVRTVAGDYVEHELSGAMQNDGLTADIVRTYQEKWNKGKTLCFAVDKAHARHLQERFQKAGINAAYQDGDTTGDERKDIKKKFHSGEYQVVVNIMTLTTGTDWDVRCLILARPTKSAALFLQIIGRALRIADGKEDALILDHSSTTSNLGFVTEIDIDDLDDGKSREKDAKPREERKEPLPKECEGCAYLMPPRSPSCPNCGRSRRPECTVFEADGNLIEIKPGCLTKVATKKQWSYEEKKVFLAELKGYAADKGYKPGWAAMKYRDKFHEPPPYFMNSVKASEVISPGTLQFIRAGNIRWAKSKHNPEARA